jgi:Transposase DDE domain
MPVLKKVSADLPGCLRQIVDPQAWKSLHGLAGDFEQNRSRWNLQPLLLVGLAMALDCARTVGERFGTATELDWAVRPKQRRCGTTLAGFLLALACLPVKVFGGVRTVLQNALLKADVHPARVDRWNAYGLDGTKQNLPRTDANELGFGAASQEPALPQGVTVAAVALGECVLWDWEGGGAYASERDLALTIIRRLPAGSLVVEDAGFVGYEHIRETLASGKHLLVRVGANVSLWAQTIGHAQQHGGEVWLWPNKRQDEAPLKLRLIKIVTRKKKKLKSKKRKGQGRRRSYKIVRTPLWLLTDVLDENKLTQAEAEEIYGRRWGGNEIRFRDWKCTLNAATLLSRTPEQAQRERELSLCAAMLLHVMVTRARKARRKPFRRVSAANAARAWRKAVRQSGQGKSTRWFGAAMSEAVVDDYERQRPKVKRRWPKRKEHTMAGQPKFRKLTRRIKAMGLKRLEEKRA